MAKMSVREYQNGKSCEETLYRNVVDWRESPKRGPIDDVVDRSSRTTTPLRSDWGIRYIVFHTGPNE
jgi:hypothetical protein